MLRASDDVLIFNPSTDAIVAGPVANSPAAKMIECEPICNATESILQSICSHEDVGEDLSDR
jgi:hypothetical protein